MDSHAPITWGDIRFALTDRSQPALFWLSADAVEAKAETWLNIRRAFPDARMWEVDLSEVNVVSLGAELKKRLPLTFFEEPSLDTFVHVHGLENSIGNFGQTEFLAEINFERDALFRDYPFNILIWTDTQARQQVQRHAKDFWHWVNYDFVLPIRLAAPNLPAVGVLFHEADAKNVRALTDALRRLERNEKLTVASVRAMPDPKAGTETVELDWQRLSVLIVWFTPRFLDGQAARSLAAALAGQKKLVVLPVIAERCDWKSSPMGHYAAIPDNVRTLKEAAAGNERGFLETALEQTLSEMPANADPVSPWGLLEQLLDEGHAFWADNLLNRALAAEGADRTPEDIKRMRARCQQTERVYLRYVECLFSEGKELNLEAVHWRGEMPRYVSNWFVYFVSNVKYLNLFGCDISDLSPLDKLAKLRVLFCDATLVSDLSPLANLTALQLLSCSSTLVSDLSPLANLTKLQSFSCGRTQVSDLSPLANLTALRWLVFPSTRVSDLAPLAKLTTLQSLDCSSTQISDLSPIANLTALQSLFCYKTQVSNLAPLAKLTALKMFDCYQTQVSDLAPLAKLTALQSLNCSETEVSDLSPILAKILNGIDVKWETWGEHHQEDTAAVYQLPAILVRDCPLVIPPAEVAQESPQAVRDYFGDVGDDGRTLNEVKIVFLGEASAGKTSLVKRLLGEAFDSKESQTHGIRIRQAPFVMDDGDTVTAHLWDFGGQEVMHATHQFFLSQRSIYVLLLNSRNDDHAEKWLKLAASFGGRSPVLVVLNKVDENPSFDVNRKNLSEKYPQIRDYFRVSARSGTGIAELREALRREIDRAETRRTPFPKHWLAVKEHFSNMQADYIESAEYRAVCEKNGLTRSFSQDVLLQFLHDLGLVINFRTLKNFDTQILNPLWLTNGVYRIINSEIVARAGGLLREQDFDAVINDPRYLAGNTSERVFQYPVNKLLYIVRVMQEFELCFPLDTRSYIVPQLLPVQEPVVILEGSVLRFVIQFPDFLPDSVFPRLMVKLHPYISGFSEAVAGKSLLSQIWRTGMVLHKPTFFNALARVRWDKEDQTILVDVCGDERRRFLSFIRETVKEIVADLTSLKFQELVPIPGGKDFLEYEGLVEAEKAGEKEIFVWQAKKKLWVSDLLDGVEEPVMRDEVEQLPVRAFVSYAHKDLEYLKELRSALAPLMRLQKLQLWDDRDINAGDEWEKVIFQQLDESDIVLCLVSADFVASDFCYKKEFGAALEAHRKGEKTIVPIMLRQTDWKDLPLAEIQGTPGGNEWIASAADKDAAWTKVSAALRPALERAKQRRKKALDAMKMGR